MIIKKLLKFILFISLINVSTFASDAAGHTICLNMIVKNESEVIQRCLSSILPFIDYWVIVDTGSTDGTQQVIKEFLKDIPGELYERPWVNFAHNRNEALQLAKFKTDFVLIMDADDFLTYPSNYVIPNLTHDAYLLRFEDQGTQYYRIQLINSQLPWKWKGVLHEYLDCSEPCSSQFLPQDLTYVRYYDGARSKDPEKYLKDVNVLLEGLKKEPFNSRYVFYLAESYRCANQYEKAIEQYYKRSTMGGWSEEVYWSLLQIGLLKERLDKPPKEIIGAYYQAFNNRPTRAESLYYLSRYYRQIGEYHAAYAFAEQGLKIPLPTDYLFVEKWIYDYGFLFEFSVSAYWVEDYKNAQTASYNLLANPHVPDYLREYIIKNLEWINPRLNNQ